MDGWQLAREIKANRRISNSALILLCSIGRRTYAAKAKQPGFAEYLVKPICQAQLLDCMVMVMGIVKQSEQEKESAFVIRHTKSEEKNMRKRILVVEDNINNQRATALLLKNAGYPCDVANNGIEALLAISRILYGSIFMDCQMPEMNGFEATAKIREQEEGNRHIPIIALTGNAMVGERRKCLEAGMDDYLAKPIKGSELIAMAKKWMKTDNSQFDSQNI